MLNISPKQYGQGDSTFIAVGGEEGVRKLVDHFYDVMETLPKAEEIRSMHPADLTESRTKLWAFLCGWMGGPRKYAELYGSINIPKVHMHLRVEEEQRDAWLLCMDKAIDEMAYPASLKNYLLEQLFVPADRVRMSSRGDGVKR